MKPPWLRPGTIAFVAALHAIVGWLLTTAALQPVIPVSLDSIGVDLMPEGDFYDQQEIEAVEKEAPPEEIEQPDLALPPPNIMAPETPPLAVEQKHVEQKKRIERKRTDVAEERREAQAPRKRGAPGARGGATSMSRASYAGLLAAAIRRHVPASTALGHGSAHVSFHVTAGGAIAVIAASGSSPAHTALARQIIMSVHAPPPPGGSFVASQNFIFD